MPWQRWSVANRKSNVKFSALHAPNEFDLFWQKFENLGVLLKKIWKTGFQGKVENLGFSLKNVPFLRAYSSRSSGWPKVIGITYYIMYGLSSPMKVENFPDGGTAFPDGDHGSCVPCWCHPCLLGESVILQYENMYTCNEMLTIFNNFMFHLSQGIWNLSTLETHLPIFSLHQNPFVRYPHRMKLAPLTLTDMYWRHVYAKPL